MNTFLYIIIITQVLYTLYMVYRAAESIKLILFVAGVILVLYMSLPGNMLRYIHVAITAHMLFVGIKYFINKTPKRENQGRYIPQEERNDEKLYLESDLGTIEVANPYRSILVSGGAGSGKSKSVFYPFIRQFMTSEYSGLLYDFKSPELTEFAYSEFKKVTNSKVNFKVLDFKNPDKSNKCNPLSPRYITKQSIALEMATVLINNLLPESIKKKDFFTRSSISILAGCIWFLAKNTPQFSTLPHLIAMVLDYPSAKIIEVVCSDRECAGMLSSIREAYEMKAEKQIGAVLGTLKMALGQINIPEVFELMSEDEINLDLNDPSSPTFLCLGNDSTLSSTYGPVISLIISCCIRQMNQPNKHKSAVILDELPTIYVAGLESLPATARSNKVISMLGLQDVTQLYDSYGNDKAQVLLSNCGNQFYGRTTNEKTADMLTKLAGKQDVTYTSKSSGTSSGENNTSHSEGTTQSIQQRERITSSDILQLKPGEFVGMVADNELLPYFNKVQFAQIENIEYQSLLEIARIDSKLTLEAIYNQIQDISLPNSNEPKLLDIEIEDPIIVESNPLKEENTSSNSDDIKFDF